MTLDEMDRKCNELFRELDRLKSQGLHKIIGGEYDRVMYELQSYATARLGLLHVNAQETNNAR